MTDEKQCEARHKSLKIFIGLLTVLVVGLITLPIWSTAASNRAVEKVADIDKTFGEHAAAQKVEDRHIHNTLGEIKEDIKEMRKTILDRLSEVEKAVHGK